MVSFSGTSCGAMSHTVLNMEMGKRVALASHGREDAVLSLPPLGITKRDRVFARKQEGETQKGGTTGKGK